MKHVVVSATTVGLSIDPTGYLALLPQLASALPAGARAFALDPNHHDFGGSRCVKDLTIERVSFLSVDGRLDLGLGLRHNCWKHEEDLVITYSGVCGFALSTTDGTANWTGLAPVILDEITPHEQGCSHEIACLAGSLSIVCRDLNATWVPAECPDRHS
jgi:hypothetical protein